MEDSEQIVFEEMPDMFGKMFAGFEQEPTDAPTIRHKTYNSLYEELCDKCNPAQFMDRKPYDADLVSSANKIYRKVLESEGNADYQNELMHEAYYTLGVKFDGTSMYDYLLDYLDPHLYLSPYSPDDLEVANRYYQAIIDNRYDRIALESIRDEAQWFIDKVEAEMVKRRTEQALIERTETTMQVSEMIKTDRQWINDAQNYLGEDNWRWYVEEEYGGYIKS